MNILLLNWRDPKNPKSGGAEIATLEHVKAWVKAGHTVTWFSAIFPNAEPQETINDITYIRKGNELSVFIFAVFFYLFSHQKFDLVVDEIHGIPFFTPLYVGQPKIAFIHEVANEIWDYMYPFPLSLIGRFLEKILLFPYKGIPFITVSESTRQELIGLSIPKDKIHVIHNGLVYPFLKTLPKKNKNFTCLFISRLVKMKGIEEVIKAFGFIHKENSAARLIIVGKGEKQYVYKLKMMAKDYGIEEATTFLQNVSNNDKWKIMRGAHLLLHASVKEGWGLVVVEAASQGTPSVVYNVSGLRDSVKSGVTGVVSKVNSPYELAIEALKLYKNKKRYTDFQKNGLQLVKTLSWSKSTQKSLQLLTVSARMK